MQLNRHARSVQDTARGRFSPAGFFAFVLGELSVYDVAI